MSNQRIEVGGQDSEVNEVQRSYGSEAMKVNYMIKSWRVGKSFYMLIHIKIWVKETLEILKYKISKHHSHHITCFQMYDINYTSHKT